MEQDLYIRAWMLYKMTRVKIDELIKAQCFRQPIEVHGYDDALKYLREVADVLYRMPTE